MRDPGVAFLAAFSRFAYLVIDQTKRYRCRAPQLSENPVISIRASQGVLRLGPVKVSARALFVAYQ